MSDQRTAARSERPVVTTAVHDAPGDPMAAPGSRLTCSSTAVPGPNGLVMVLRVVGEVDLSTVDLLRTALGGLVAQRPAHLVVDLAALGFCSVRGLTVLCQAGDTALGGGTGYAVAGASAQINRVWSMGWTAAEQPIGFATAGDAVFAAMAHQVGAQDRARWEPKQLMSVPAEPAVRTTVVALVSPTPPPRPEALTA